GADAARRRRVRQHASGARQGGDAAAADRADARVTGVPEEIAMDRRAFLKNGSLALVTLGFAPAFISRTVQAARARQKVLVAIFQRGAVDGLNMIVPHGEKAYYAARPSIAIPRPNQPDGAVDLDGFFGLHPRMAPLEPFF